MIFSRIAVSIVAFAMQSALAGTSELIGSGIPNPVIVIVLHT